MNFQLDLTNRPIVIKRKRFSDAVEYLDELLERSREDTIPINTSRYRTAWDVFRHGDEYIHLSRLETIKLRTQIEYALDAGYQEVKTTQAFLRKLPAFRKLKSEIYPQLAVE